MSSYRIALPTMLAIVSLWGQGDASSMDSGAAIAQGLRNCPSWGSIPARDTARRREVTEIYTQLAHHKTPAIRAGIELYLKPYSSSPEQIPQYLEASDKVFAFLRVVFNVPLRFNPKTEHLPISISGNPTGADGSVNVLWPFSLDGAGHLALTGVDPGLHTGIAYDPLSDFDAMASHYQRRFPADAN